MTMKFLKISLQTALLYAFYIAGDWIRSFFHLPISGSIIGLLLLWLALVLKIYPSQWIESGSDFVQRYMPLFFIPAIVGIMNYFQVFTGKGILLVPLIAISTLITMGTSGYISQFIALRMQKRKERKLRLCKEHYLDS